MLDFILSKMTWLITSVLVMSFILGFYQVQVDGMSGELLQSTAEEIKSIVAKVDGTRGNLDVNVTFDRYNSYRAFYLPGQIGGDVYEITITESYVRLKQGKKDVAVRFGFNILPMRHPLLGNLSLDALIENESYASYMTFLSDQDFSVAARMTPSGNQNTYIFLQTDIVYSSVGGGGGTDFLKKDVDSPELSEITVSPAALEVHEPVNISIEVKSDMLQRVMIDIDSPDGIFSRSAMMPGSGNLYYFEAAYPMLGDYQYMVWADDDFGRFNFTEYHILTIVDTTPPEISGISDSPDPLEASYSNKITATVTDNFDVQTVKVRIHKQGGGWDYDFTMLAWADDVWTYQRSYYSPGIYNYEITGYDSSGNSKISTTRTFKVVDTTAPTISYITATPSIQYNGGSVIFSAKISDHVSVANVKISIDGTEYTMTEGNNDKWSFSMSFSDSGDHTYRIIAVDQSGNQAASTIKYFTIKEPVT